MGKMKRARGDKVEDQHPLARDLIVGKYAKASSRDKSKKEKPDEHYVNDSLSAKILQQARMQQNELEDELDDTSEDYAAASQRQPKSFLGAPGSNPADSDNSEEDDDDDFELGDAQELDLEISPEDAEALEKFMDNEHSAAKKGKTLQDVILEKIAEKQTELSTKFSDVSCQMRQLDPRLVEMYKGVGEVLSHYRSGKLPKAFKIIPKLVNWEQILQLTCPEKWSASAMFQATRIFVSNLNSKMCQRFQNLILLPRIRDDIAEYKKLNSHLYMATKKALFKPGPFFKGFLLPLCESNTCTIREAQVIGSTLTHCTIAMLHSCACMLKLAEMEYNGANSIFLRILIEKKYTLPYRVVDALVNHFVRFASNKREELPVLWHQCLLSFCSIYKEDISTEQKEELNELLKIHSHRQITPEIRHILLNSTCRDVEIVDQRDITVDNPDML